MLPESLAYPLQTDIFQLICEVGNRAKQVHRSHGVPNNFFLLAYRQVGLIIFIRPGPEVGGIFPTSARLFVKIVRSLPSFLDKVLAEMKIASLTGRAIQFDQGQLNFLVAAISMPFSFLNAKDRCDIISIAQSRVQQHAFAGCLEMSHSGLYEVPGAVEFVEVA